MEEGIHVRLLNFLFASGLHCVSSDYRGLKKLITIIRKTREGLSEAASPTDIRDEQTAGPSRLSDATEPDNDKSKTLRPSDETVLSQRIAGPSRQSDVFERDSSDEETPRPSDDTVSSQRVSSRNRTVLHPSFKTPIKPPPIDTSGSYSVPDGQARKGSMRGRRSSFAQAMSIAGFRKGPQSLHSRSEFQETVPVGPTAKGYFLSEQWAASP